MTVTLHDQPSLTGGGSLYATDQVGEVGVEVRKSLTFPRMGRPWTSDL